MALNNVMPLYPQTQPPEPQSHFSGTREEGSVESRGKGFRDSLVALWLMSHVTLAKVIPSSRTHFPPQSKMRSQINQRSFLNLSNF